ncbi:MAG: 3'-5' exonuclease, partial [Planctomycetota bacterium]
KPLLPSQICVLVRKNFQGVLIQEALRARQIPAIIKSTGNVFKSEEAQDLQYVLQAILEPHQSNFIRTALVTNIFGKTAEDLVRLQTEESALEDITGLMQDYHQIWKRSGIVSLARSMMSRSKVHTELLQRPQGKRRLTNFLHLIDLLHQASLQQKLSMEQTLGWLSKQIFEEEEEIEAYHLRPESPEEAVQIVTIHSAKGLEYPIVFCPFSWEEVKWTPGESLYYNQDSEQCLNFTPNASSQELAIHEIMAEELRLLYVALTRTIHRCYLVTRPAQEMGKYSILSHLLGETLDRFEAFSSIQVHLLVKPNSQPVSFTQKERFIPKEMNFHPFETPIVSDWKIASFSALTKKKSTLEEEPIPSISPLLEGFGGEEEAPVSILANKPQGMFAFPKGDRAGICLHEILAEIDFTIIQKDPSLETIRPLIREKLRLYQYAEEHFSVYESTIQEMLGQVLTTPLSREAPFSLSQISRKNCLIEMEFFFPQKWLSRELLRELWSQIMPTYFSKEEVLKSEKRIESLDFQPVQGFMR